MPNAEGKIFDFLTEDAICQELVTKKIYTDLKKKINTQQLKVTTVYNTRGGFDTTCIEGHLNR